ncbi:MAG: hypothetical protein K8S87_11405 [Planctomycetes bacterium]|nr:hypothetical protein [Planctomycetota bacterium]
MKRTNKIFISMLLILVFLFGIAVFTGCANPPETRLSESMLDYHETMILENPALTQEEKELWLLLVLQANNIEQVEITKQIEYFKVNGILKKLEPIQKE